MSYLLFGFVVALALLVFVYLMSVIRAAVGGQKFRTTGELMIAIVIIAVGAGLLAWLGPIALAGVGIL